MLFRDVCSILISKKMKVLHTGRSAEGQESYNWSNAHLKTCAYEADSVAIAGRGYLGGGG